MVQWIKKLSIAKVMFLLFYAVIAFFAVKGDNLLDKFYFVCLTICMIRLFLLYRRKNKNGTS